MQAKSRTEDWVKWDIAAARKAASEEAARLIRLAAEPVTKRDTVTRRIARAAERLGWPLRRVEAIWWREARRIESFELDQLRTIPQRQVKK